MQLDDVLLIADDGNVTIGTPTIEGARVLADVEAHGRAKKIIVFKYKAKVRSRKKTGHRQSFTRLVVREILRPGEESKTAEAEAEAKPRRRRKAEEEETPAEAVEAPATEAVEAPTTEAVETPVVESEAPKRRTRRAPEPKAKADEPKPRARRKAAEPEAGETKPARRRTPRPKKE